MAQVGMNPAVTPTFGRLTANQPRGINNITNLEFINMVSASAAPQAGSGGPGQLDANTASDYAGILDNMNQGANKPSFLQNPIKFVSNLVLRNQLSSAQNA